ncbi:MAG: hypothetical protein EA365_10530 [Gloeocapsa sp. DLM2.Bin57]|nr:MAG: hypothetical protein EA365_10530 [Gloeocapsa sp. DLM2.Bin57]
MEIHRFVKKSPHPNPPTEKQQLDKEGINPPVDPKPPAQSPPAPGANKIKKPQNPIGHTTTEQNASSPAPSTNQSQSRHKKKNKRNKKATSSNSKNAPTSVKEELLPLTPEPGKEEGEDLESAVINGVKIQSEDLDPLTKKVMDMMDSRHAETAVCLFAMIYGGIIVSTPFGLAFSLFMLPLIRKVFEEMSFFSECKRQRKRVERTEWRIFEFLRHKLGDSGEEITYRIREPRLTVEGVGNLDILIKADYGLVFALSVITFDETDGRPVKVFYDSIQKTIMYRKPRGPKRAFHSNPVETHLKVVEHLVEHQPDLMAGKVINMIIFTHPVEIFVHPDSPMIDLGKRLHLYFKDIYFIEENRAFRLIAKLKHDEKVRLESEQPQS